MIPDYVTARNEQAVAAGLVIAKQVTRGDRLNTWYVGTESQWRASGFCKRTRPFLTRSAMYAEFRCYAPVECDSGRISFHVTAISGDTFRGTLANERLPEWVEYPQPGVTAYGFTSHDGPTVAYAGPLQSLVKLGVLTPELAADPEDDNLRRAFAGRPDDRGVMALMAQGASIVDLASHAVRNFQLLPDGRGLVWDYVAKREAKALKARDAGRVNFKSPGDMRRFLGMLAGLDLLKRAVRFEGRDGNVYALIPDSAEPISSAIGELEDAIRCADVLVRPREPDLAAKATAARRDQAFRLFLDRTRGATQ